MRTSFTGFDAAALLEAAASLLLRLPVLLLLGCRFFFKFAAADPAAGVLPSLKLMDELCPLSHSLTQDEGGLVACDEVFHLRLFHFAPTQSELVPCKAECRYV
jgi:hypothetical protein